MPDGATLQAGIGAVPDAALQGLTARRSLRVWTEMFSDSMLALERAGALDADVPITTSFVFGSAELYAWLHRNERVRMTRTEVTNDPTRISANPLDGQHQLLARGRPLRPGQRLAGQRAGSTRDSAGRLTSWWARSTAPVGRR